MTFAIQRPETEALIQQRLQAGAFTEVEDVLLDALRSAPAPDRRRGRAAGGLKSLIDAAQGLGEAADSQEIGCRDGQ